MDPPPTSAEILVHIAAPSTARADVRYRAQVHALLGFDLVSRQCILTSSSFSSSPSPTLPATDPELDVDINAPTASTAPKQKPQPENAAADLHQSWDSPISVIPDSQPLPISSTDAEDHAANNPPTPNIRKATSSPLPSPELSAAKRCRVDSRPNSAATAAAPILSHPPTAQEQPQDQEQDQQPQPPCENPNPTTTNAIDNPNPSSPHLSQLAFPLEIKPPLPPISSNPFETHLTPTLTMLAARLKSSRTFTPVTQTRELDKLERGHWRVQITLVESAADQSAYVWDSVFFARFWAFLSEFINEQRAGWGVWCIVEEDTSENDRGNADEGVGAQSLTRVVLKVYAWGEVASHIYLLLFLATERRIRKLGAQWRDGKDEVVIQMPCGFS